MSITACSFCLNYKEYINSSADNLMKHGATLHSTWDISSTYSLGIHIRWTKYGMVSQYRLTVGGASVAVHCLGSVYSSDNVTKWSYTH